MKKSHLLLASVCAAATGLIPLAPAMADAPVGVSGSIGAGYGDYSAEGSTANAYGGGGSLAFGFGGAFGAQVDVNYDSLSGSAGGGSGSLWGVGGSLFWAPGNWGRLGASVAYQQFSIDGDTLDLTNYGGFVEWYAGPAVTIAAKVGGVSLSASGCGGEGNSLALANSCSDSSSGWYAGGGLTGYLMPDLALSGDVDYLSFTGGSETSYGVGVEWLVSEATPISIGGGYTNISLSGGGPSISEWNVALKFYFNGDNSMSLRDRQRNGASTWAVEAPKFVGF